MTTELLQGALSHGALETVIIIFYTRFGFFGDYPDLQSDGRTIGNYELESSIVVETRTPPCSEH
jgi:hypothetical protein